MTKLIYILFIVSCTFSQVSQVWDVRYNGSGNNMDWPSALAVDATGNIYVAGASVEAGSGQDVCVIKYNSAGIQQWIRYYNGPGNISDGIWAMAVDNSGNVLVTGYSSQGSINYDYVTIKYNTDGVQQWVARYNGTGNGDDQARCIAIDISGSVYVTGRSTGTNTGNDIVTIKYNASGLQQWIQRYNGQMNGDDIPWAIGVDTNGNIYITGGVSIYNYYQYYTTIKYNSSGIQQWVVNLNGNVPGVGTSLCLDRFGNVYTTGCVDQSISTSYQRYLTAKYLPNGDTVWVKKYTGPGNGDVARKVKIDSLSNVYVTGKSVGSSTGSDYCTVKYNSNGIQQWVARYGTSGDDYCRDMVIDYLGNIYVTGYTIQPNTYVDYTTIKYNSSGAQQWLMNYSGLGGSWADDQAIAIVLDNLNNVYVTGESDGINEEYDITTLKYSQIVNVSLVKTEMPQKFKLSDNYPNPFNPSTAIKFDLPKSTLVQIVVYDILGREVQQLLNEEKKPGSYEITWDGSSFASGIYFYKIVTDEFVETKKMVLMK